MHAKRFLCETEKEILSYTCDLCATKFTAQEELENHMKNSLAT